jgi:copper chaperone NosL
MKSFKALASLSLLILLTACTSGPEPLRYGQESCAHCKMSISDKRFGAEVVTKKGKVYKYDAIECMLAATDEDKKLQEDALTYWVVDASDEGDLVNANSAQYLVSEKLPSPMGANLTAYGSREKAEAAQAQFGGKILNWKDIADKH